MSQPCLPESLFSDLTRLIAEARTRAAVAVNAEITLLYWHIGRRIRIDVLKEERADYGKQVLLLLAEKLTCQFGRGWSEKQLRHCLRFAETFEDEKIVSALRRELSWTHIKTIIYIDDPLKRSFYMELCRLEKWSTRQLSERLNSMLYERTALSKKPEETIAYDLEYLTSLPDKGLLEQKLHQAIVSARQRFIEGPQ